VNVKHSKSIYISRDLTWQKQTANISKWDRGISLASKSTEGRRCPPPIWLGGVGDHKLPKWGMCLGHSTGQPRFGRFCAWKSPFGDKKIEEMCYFWWFCKSGISWIPRWMAGIHVRPESERIMLKAGRLACLQNISNAHKLWRQHTVQYNTADYNTKGNVNILPDMIWACS